MLQHINGIDVEVVDLRPELPQRPIHGYTDAEVLSLVSQGIEPPQGGIGFYAMALDQALANGVITEPGMYGIELYPGFGMNLLIQYRIYKID